MPFRLRGTGASDCQKEATKVRRFGQERSAHRSPVASLIILAGLIATSAFASAAPAGWDDLAGPLRALTSAGSALQQVEVTFRSPQDAACTDLSALGAVVEYRRDCRAQCLVPACNLLDLAALPQVAQVSEPARPITCQGFGAVVSEAVQFTNASAMQISGFSGAPATIAIIDIGFNGIAAAEVPAGYELVSLRSDQSTTASNHGTAMAETVADMAPGANLLLVAVDTPLSIEAAADFVAGRGVEVAVSGLVVVEGPFDGTHSLSRAVNSADASGLLWVQAAGNLARRHWSGEYTDDDGDGIHEFGNKVEGITLALNGGTFDAYLSWYQTAGTKTSQDYDLVLVDGQGNVVAQSSITQNGDDHPRERLHAAVVAGTYNLQIRAVSIDESISDTFQLYIPDVDISPDNLQVAEGSLPVPAEATGAFTVGAVRGTAIDPAPYNLPAVQLDNIEPFSSQGPTVTGAMKPNMVAPDACRTSLAAVGAAPISAGGEFIAPNAFGTSFAAAHVAGALALLWSEDTTRSKIELRDAILRLAVDVPPPLPPAEPLPNSIYGEGRLNLRVGTDVAKPVCQITYPRSGETISTTEPVITAFLSDVGSGVQPTSIVLTIDGVAIDRSDIVFDAATGLLTYRVGPPSHAPLSRSSHRITLDCQDFQGNAAQQAVSSFRVSPPQVDAGLHMISLPFADLAPGTKTPSAIFGLPPDQVIVVRWVPTDATVGDKYHWWGGPAQIEDQFASFEPLDALEPPFVVADPPAGLGYFLSIPTSAILNVSGRSLADQVSYDVKLSVGSTPPRGWNMIGCPFPDAVTWGGVEFITDGVRQDLREAIDSGVTEGILFALKKAGASYYYDFPSDPLSGSVSPFQGYWLHVLKDTTLRLYNGVITGASTGAKASSQAPSVDNWVLKFGASAAGGQDPANYIGVTAAATDGYDAGADVPEPPAVSSPVRVFMARDDWGTAAGQYVKDVRGAVGTAQVWGVTVECAQADTDVTLSWPEINAQVPAGVTLVLTDLDAGRDVFMRTVSGYTYRSSSANSSRRFEITATPSTDRALTMTNVQAQQAPGGTVTLAYTVNAAADVEAEILNIAGRTISRLGSRPATAGAVQTLTWNGRNIQGSRVPPGRYMVRLTARTEDGQAASAVRTFQVTR